MLAKLIASKEAESNAPSTFAAMKTARRWLLFSPDKVPHYIDGTKRRGTLDTPEDIARMATYAKALAVLAKYDPAWHLGFALGPDDGGGYWQGIDLDHVEQKELADLTGGLLGYVEASPSGRGIHAIGYGRHFRTLGSNGSGIEAYSVRRGFTVTENMIRDGELICLADSVEKVLAPRHKPQGQNPSPTANAPSIVQVSAQAVTDLRSALNHMRADEYSLWIEIGHALKSLGDIGRGLWLDWSSMSSKYDPQQAVRKWDSFAPQHTSYQAVFAKAQMLGWVNPGRNAALFAQFSAEQPSEPTTIVATPFTPPEFQLEIPPRPWVFGRWLLRGTVTAVVAPGGTGKSALMVATALSLATGRALLRKTVYGGPHRVWLWNLEDDRDELTRQIVACSLQHGINEWDYEGRLFVNDATLPLCTAARAREGLTIHEPVNAALAAEIRARQIDVLIVDPFVSSHRAEENDNGQIDTIAKRWASIAREANCSVVLVHHSRKLGGQQVDTESARGASALGNAVRSVLVLNRMTETEATRLGIPRESRRGYIQVGNDKSNRAPAEVADWFRLISVKIANGGPDGGDDVAVVERWMPPEVMTALDDETRSKIQEAIATGEWRESPTATAWAGHAVAKVIGAELSNAVEKIRVKKLLKSMIAREELKIETRRNEYRKLTDFVVVGEKIKTDCGSPNW